MATTAPPGATATNAELIRWAFDVINTHDVSPLKEFWNAETVERFPTRTARGTADISSYFGAAFAAMPDLRIEIVELAAQDDNVFVRWHMSGTHDGTAWEGIAPSGRRVELDGMDHFVIRDGSVVSNFVIFDQVQFARAVGLMPEAGTPGDRALKGAFALRVKAAQALRKRSD